jgi:Replication-relaxation
VSCPAGRPPASKHRGEKPHADAVSQVVSPTKDLRSSLHISARRLAEIEAGLDALDRELIETVARFRVMSSRQLRALFFTGGSPQAMVRAANRRLARLSDTELLSRLPRRVGGVRAGGDGLVFAVGLAGQRVLAGSAPARRPRRPHAPGARYLAHTLAVAELYVMLMGQAREGCCELLVFEPEPACWREYPGHYGAPMVLKPDAAVRLVVGEFELSWLIEVDLATEALPTIEGKARRHLDYHRSGVERREHGISPRVLWVTPTPGRSQAIALALASLPPSAQDLFALATAGAAARTLIAGAPA